MPKIVDHEKYRKELLWKSFDLFASKGYGSVTMREIAKELGVSTGTLYHYFPNKETLYLQLVEEQTEQDISNFFTEAGNPETLEERIKVLMNFIQKNEDYFIKQTLLSYDFYQQQERSEVLNNHTLKKAWEYTEKAVADYLQIEQKQIIKFVLNLIGGLFTSKMFGGEEIAAYEEQGELLAKMLTAYLGNG
ncbi:MAG: TetR/AcrR family transcriptional regulator [Nostocales cyanobacterium 94392]|nr:TetR/AcrR family transcriptional regulator [Nostocales cyanobacterium 94392]